jgi:4-amino-4-deoxychorismate lyase
MSEMLGCWIDGAAGQTLPADDRGLAYGDGLFETMLVRAGQVRFIDAHLDRLSRGCERLAIPFAASAASRAELRAEIAHAARLAPPLAILKLIVTRGSAARRGYVPGSAMTPRRVLSLFAVNTEPGVASAAVTLRVATLRLGENPALAGLKHLNRLENVLAAGESGHESCFESLLLDAAGNLICGTMSNVFAVKHGRLVTPVVDRCGVAGVMRGIVMRECGALAIGMEQRPLPLSEFLAADEAFVTNVRIGVVPVRNVGEHSFPMNETTLRLARHIEALDA